MLEGKRIGFVGAGQMAEAMIGGLIRNGLVPPERIIASAPRLARRESLQATFGIRCTGTNSEAVLDADFVLITTKPQMMRQVMKDLKGHLHERSLVISIAAGISIEKLSSGLDHHLIVRAMPNTPGKINQGITVWTATDEVSEIQRAQASHLLAALGQQVFVEHERYLDMATALSGTGPMYVFLFMESLVDAGVRMGLPRYLAEQMVIQTTLGSAEYARQAGQHLAALRNDVTSPGGTSAEALYELDRTGFRTSIAQAVHSAYERSVELGR